jgi:outer membrane immunogenic protein
MKLVVALLAGLFGATSALAADLPARTYTKAPIMVEPVYNWTGFYIGGNVGYSWGRSSDTSYYSNGAGTLFTSAGRSNLDGASAAARSATIGRCRTGCGASRPTYRAPTKKAAVT